VSVTASSSSYQLNISPSRSTLAYYTDPTDVKTLKREQARINADVEEADTQLATDGEKLKQVKDIIDLALHLAKSCAASYRKARAEVRRIWNQAFFRSIRVRDGRDRAVRLRGAIRVKGSGSPQTDRSSPPITRRGSIRGSNHKAKPLFVRGTSAVPARHERIMSIPPGGCTH
jgi:hypothetical protein